LQAPKPQLLIKKINKKIHVFEEIDNRVYRELCVP
jgi:hypothetical protein